MFFRFKILPLALILLFLNGWQASATDDGNDKNKLKCAQSFSGTQSNPQTQSNPKTESNVIALVDAKQQPRATRIPNDFSGFSKKKPKQEESKKVISFVTGKTIMQPPKPSEISKEKLESEKQLLGLKSSSEKSNTTEVQTDIQQEQNLTIAKLNAITIAMNELITAYPEHTKQSVVENDQIAVEIRSRHPSFTSYNLIEEAIDFYFNQDPDSAIAKFEEAAESGDIIGQYFMSKVHEFFDNIEHIKKYNLMIAEQPLTKINESMIIDAQFVLLAASIRSENTQEEAVNYWAAKIVDHGKPVYINEIAKLYDSLHQLLSNKELLEPGMPFVDENNADPNNADQKNSQSDIQKNIQDSERLKHYLNQIIHYSKQSLMAANRIKASNPNLKDDDFELNADITHAKSLLSTAYFLQGKYEESFSLLNDLVESYEKLDSESNKDSEGFGSAKYMLAVMYANGLGVNRDLTLFIKNLTEAAHLGSIEALLMLIHFYGVPNTMDVILSQKNLLVMPAMYLIPTSHNVILELKKIEDIHKLISDPEILEEYENQLLEFVAATTNNEFTGEQIDNLRMNPRQMGFNNAADKVKWLELGATFNHLPLLEQLNLHYMSGDTVPKNIEKARKYTKQIFNHPEMEASHKRLLFISFKEYFPDEPLFETIEKDEQYLNELVLEMSVTRLSLIDIQEAKKSHDRSKAIIANILGQDVPETRSLSVEEEMKKANKILLESEAPPQPNPENSKPANSNDES